MASTWVAVTCLGAAMMLYCHVTLADGAALSKATKHDDVHGGVPMGVINDFCDNGKDFIEMDWNPNSTLEYTCFRELLPPAEKYIHHYHCDEEAQRPIHKCMDTYLNYTEDLPTSGKHRPLWPVYGEYSFVPPQRWLHSLEHGGIVFLYDPCADPGQIELLKTLARGCLRRHVIAAYKRLPPEINFAVLAWRCKLVLSDVDSVLITKFVRSRAKHGPEAVAGDGQYSAGLKHPAEIVTDFYDRTICPQLPDLEDAMDSVQQASKDRQAHYMSTSQRLRQLLQKYITDW